MDAAAALERVRPLLGTSRLLVASDFDGTLSEPVADPWAARMLPTARRALRALAVTPGVDVALISGRTVRDLAMRVRVGGIGYRGDHGAERADARRGFRPAAIHIRREAVQPRALAVAERLKRDVPAEVPDAWLVLEDKHASVTFHFRAAPDVDLARLRVLDAVERADPEGVLVRTGSRRAVELRPSGASTKGDALATLVGALRPGAVLMLGDDRNDALAFDVVRGLRADGRVDGLAVAVAGHPDVTTVVAPRADVLLASPRECARLLRSIAHELAPPR